MIQKQKKRKKKFWKKEKKKEILLQKESKWLPHVYRGKELCLRQNQITFQLLGLENSNFLLFSVMLPTKEYKY